MAGSSSTSREAENKLKLPENDVTAHISTPFCVNTKKFNYDVIIGRDLFRELVVKLDFQNNFIGWRNINIPMEPINCKMTTHLTTQDSKNVRKETKGTKSILDAKHKKANLKKIVNSLKYL